MHYSESRRRRAPVRRFSRLAAIAIAMPAATCPSVRAQITADGATPTSVLDFGGAFAIDGGARSGANLFHSFSEFNVPAGTFAAFFGSDDVGHVISRVTGGSQSLIDGGLLSFVGAADFTFINPNGVVIGAGATIDVPGAFHVSTADRIEFADGASLDIADLGVSTFASAPPEAFGFAGDNAGAITVDGAQILSTDAPLSFSGGAFEAAAGSTFQTLSISAPAPLSIFAAGGEAATFAPGAPNVATGGSTGGAGAIRFTETLVLADDFGGGGAPIFLNGGDVSLQTSFVNATGDAFDPSLNGGLGGGATTIHVDASTFSLIDSFIATDLTAPGRSGSVSINAGAVELIGGQLVTSPNPGDPALIGPSVQSGDIRLSLSDGLTARSSDAGFASAILTGTFSGGDSGALTIDAVGDILLTDTSQVFTTAAFGGASGDLSIAADNLTLAGGAAIGSFGALASAGAAGDLSINLDGDLIVSGSDGAGQFSLIAAGPGAFTADGATPSRLSINARNIAVEDGGFVTTANFGNGPGTSLSISAENLFVRGGGAIQTDTLAAGDAGDIDIVLADALLIDDLDAARPTVIRAVSTAGAGGDAGALDISAREVRVLNGGQIQASTESAGDVSGLTITAGERVFLSGTDADGFNSGVFGSLEEGSTGTGAEALVSIAAPEIVLENGALIQTRSRGTGDSAGVVITADTVSLSGGALLSSSTFNTGDAGRLAISATALNVAGSEIVSTTEGAGAAGLVDIDVAETLTLSGDAARIATSADPGATGAAGRIEIDGPAAVIAVLDGAAITTSSASPMASAADGSVAIAVRSLLLSGANAQISSAATGPDGDAGAISLSADDISLFGESLLTTNSASGEAGDITVTLPRFGVFRLEGGAVTTTAEVGDGSGGRITIADPAAIVLEGATIEALGETAGANVQVTADFLLEAAEPPSTVAVNGVLTFDARIGDVTAAASPFTSTFIDGAVVLKNQCIVQRAGETSTLSYSEPGPARPPEPLTLRRGPALYGASPADGAPLVCSPTERPGS